MNQTIQELTPLTTYQVYVTAVNERGIESPAVQEFPVPEVSHFPVSYPLFLLLFLQPAL